MPEEAKKDPLARALGAALEGGRKALGTSWFLLKVMVPVSLAVALLDWSGVLPWIARLLSPLMGLLGLPGEAALALISGLLLNNYSAIAVMGGLDLNLREVSIVAIMCLTAHNLLVETAVMRKIGSSGTKMVALRILSALAIGYVLNLLLPASLAEIPFASASTAGRPAFLAMLAAWGLSTLKLVGKIVLLVLAIFVVQRLLEEFKAMEPLSKPLSPLMKVFGLPREASFLWIIINVVGYAYGAGIVENEIESGRMKIAQGDLFNHHAAVCHSLLEDTALYAALGVPILWITVPRVLLSILVVWLERGRRHYFRKSFSAGMA